MKKKLIIISLMAIAGLLFGQAIQQQYSTQTMNGVTIGPPESPNSAHLTIHTSGWVVGSEAVGYCGAFFAFAQQPPQNANCSTEWYVNLSTLEVACPFECPQCMQGTYNICSGTFYNQHPIDVLYINSIMPGCCNNQPPQSCEGTHNLGTFGSPLRTFNCLPPAPTPRPRPSPTPRP